MGDVPQIKIRTSRLRKLTSDTAETASAARLRYVCDTDAGISRISRKNGVMYALNGKKVSDPDTLTRIKALAIPPAWTDVWICRYPNGHLQATGRDAKGRKQYRYHVLWSRFRSLTKFSHLLDFGNALPAIKRHIRHDLALPGLPLSKVLATIVSIMQSTGIRVGSNEYEKLYGTFGLTTLKNKHVKIAGAELKFSFKGKRASTTI